MVIYIKGTFFKICSKTFLGERNPEKRLNLVAVLLKDEEEPEDFGTIVSFRSLEILEMSKVIIERAFTIISELRGDGVCTAFNEWLVKYLKTIYSGEVLDF